MTVSKIYQIDVADFSLLSRLVITQLSYVNDRHLLTITEFLNDKSIGVKQVFYDMTDSINQINLGKYSTTASWKCTSYRRMLLKVRRSQKLLLV